MTKLLYFFLIPAGLLAFWIYFSIMEVHDTDQVYLQLTSEYNSDMLHPRDFTEILAGRIITGEFVAPYDNLGIVGLRFWNFYRLNDDFLIFRLKEQGSHRWYYQSRHKVDQFQPHDYFVFGFPPIGPSAGKTYEFEIESESGRPGNAVGISPIEPAVVVKYKISREAVFSSVPAAAQFTAKKILNLAYKPKFVAVSFAYFLPFLIYTLYLIIVTWYPHLEHFGRRFLIFLLLIAVYLDAFVIPKGDSTMILLFFLVLIVWQRFQASLSIFLYLAVTLFFLSMYYYYRTNPADFFYSERLMAWSFLFFSVHFIHSFRHAAPAD